MQPLKFAFCNFLEFCFPNIFDSQLIESPHLRPMGTMYEVLFEIREHDASSFVVHSQDCFGYLRFLWFYTNVGNIFSISLRTNVGISIEVALNL